MYKFIQENACNNEMATHVSLFKPKSAFRIIHDNSSEFKELYKKAIANREPVGIAELPCAYSPFVLDFDIYASKNTSMKTEMSNELSCDLYTYSQEDVFFVMNRVGKLLYENSNNPQWTSLRMVHLAKEKKEVEHQGSVKIKQGFHIQVLDWNFRKECNIYMSRLVQADLTMKNHFLAKSLDVYAPIPWLMCYSVKDPSLKCYNPVGLYVWSTHSGLDTTNLAQTIEKMNWINLLSIRASNFNNRQELLVSVEEPVETKWLDDDVEEEEESTMDLVVGTLSDDQLSRSILALPNSLAYNYGSWWKWGRAIFILSGGSESGRLLWHQFSKKEMSKYDAVRCDKEWEALEMKKFSNLDYNNCVAILNKMSLIPYINEECKEIEVENVHVRDDIRKHLELSVKRFCETSHRAPDGSEADEFEWWEIGGALRILSGGDIWGLQLWVAISLNLYPECEQKCSDEWDTFEPSTDSEMLKNAERVIKKRIDSDFSAFMSSSVLKHHPMFQQKKILELEEKKVSMIDELPLSNNHYDIAGLIKERFKDEYVSCMFKSKDSCWYHFDGVWKLQKSDCQIRQVFFEYLDELYHSRVRDALLNRAYPKNLLDTIKLFGSTNYRSTITSECGYRMCDDEFKEKLDTNPKLFPFKNGIYDCELNIFREGRPEDMISKCANVDFIRMEMNDSRILEIQRILRQIFPKDCVFKAFMSIQCELFEGGNPDKAIDFWYGRGDNAKSFTQKLLAHMLGQLATTCPTSIITKHRSDPNTASPDVARMNPPVRLTTFNEGEKGVLIRGADLKKYTGGDAIVSRDLYQRGCDTKPMILMTKMNFVCNDLPPIEFDSALLNRIRVFPFESTFVRRLPDDPSEIGENTFLMDPHLGDRVEELSTSLASFLIDWREKYSESERTAHKNCGYLENLKLNYISNLGPCERVCVFFLRPVGRGGIFLTISAIMQCCRDYMEQMKIPESGNLQTQTENALRLKHAPVEISSGKGCRVKLVDRNEVPEFELKAYDVIKALVYTN